ncbi:MAG: phosphomannose isomerase type II C-terminal cupin domain [Bacillota bacterium]|nr:phosphomannose isomerase type II C-terminal cupin domain [Bacillota bacterium]
MSDTEKSLKASPPWGQWEVLLSEESYKVKRIIVLPGHRLSYQKHFHRSEHWVAVQGQGMITIDGQEIILNPGEAVDIPTESAHRAANRGDEPFIFIEVQRGSYLGEDDIVRLEDNYGRSGGGVTQ